MTCVHKVRWSVKRPEDCRFRLSVSHYKDRIVAPDEYSGVTEVTPSDQTQVLTTRDKLVREDITVTGITGTQVITENGEYDVVGDKSVTVDVEPNLETLSVIENGLYLPDVGVDGFDRVSVDVPVPSGSTTITENGTYDVEQYASVVVDVPQKITADGIADNSQVYGDMYLTVSQISKDRAFAGANISSVTAPNCTQVMNYAFAGCLTITQIDFPVLETVGMYGFNTIGISSAILPKLKTANVGMFANSPNLKDIRIGDDIQTIGDNFVANSQVGWSVKIKGTPTSIHARAFRFGQAGDMYVPWSEDEVANAPWGATSAAIHYNTVYDSEWNVISST